jgi:hypothetical protein
VALGRARQAARGNRVTILMGGWPDELAGHVDGAQVP